MMMGIVFAALTAGFFAIIGFEPGAWALIICAGVLGAVLEESGELG